MIPRYSRPEMVAIWSPETRFRIWFEIEAHACDAMAQLGVIPQANADAVWTAAKADFNVARIDEIEAVTKHDVIAFLTHLGEIIGPDQARFVHQGMTSSDVLDTCFNIQLVRAADLLVADDAVLLAAVDASPKIIRSLATNKSPALLALATPNAEQIRRAEIIANAPEFRARVAQALAARFPKDPAAPTPPVEKQIFGGFYSNADKALLGEFQRADWPRRQEIASTLADPRLRQLGRRLVAFHAHSQFCGSHTRSRPVGR